MKLALSPIAFSTGYCVCYVVVLAFDVALFIYYPQAKEFSWGWRRLVDIGPGIAWYGLMATAIIGATAIALLASATKLPILRGYLWCFPVIGLVGCVFLMRHFFLI